MKLNDSFKFSHPVLSDSTDDFADGSFDVEFEITERPASGELRIKYQLEIQSPSTLAALKTGQIRCHLSVVCRESFYNEFIQIEYPAGIAEVAGGLLNGRVQLRALLVLSNDGVLESTEVSPEYETQKFILNQGSIMGWTDTQFISVGMEKLAPMESIFRLSQGKHLQPGGFEIAQDDEFINVVVAEDLFPSIHAMRGNSLTKPVVLNSIYVPAVMSALDTFKNGDGSFSERRWFRVIRAKAELIGLDISSGSSLVQAQELLKYPAGRLIDFARRIP